MKYLFITDSDGGNTDSAFEYLLGFQPSLGAMILSKTRLVVFLDGRYFEKTKHIDTVRIAKVVSREDIKVEFIQFDDMLPTLRKYLNGEENMCFQENIALSYFKGLEDIFSPEHIHFERGHFLKKRAIKNRDEKVKIKNAISIIDTVMQDMKAMIYSGEVIGKTEKEVRTIILQKIYEYGAESESFEAIVAFGENSAIPHHVPDDTIITQGVILLDMGAKYQGYCSDCTRTFWVGEKNTQFQKFREVYEIVKKSHNAAYQGYSGGMTASDLDGISRDIIQKSDYKDLFIHSLGHSIGIDIHEDPRIRKTDTTVLENGMVFTIEPGIYITGEFGIRLEDIVFLENTSLKKYSSLDLDI